MSLATLLNNVTEITRRPDARARALIALNSIILEIVTNDDYAQDLVESTLPNPSGNALAEISLVGVTPGVRKICYLTANDIPHSSVTPSNILDPSGQCPQVNIYYRSGNKLVIRSRMEFSEIRLGYYQAFTGLAEAAGFDTHWLIDEYEPMLTNGVIGQVFRATGDDVSARDYEAIYKTQRLNIRAGLAEAQ